MKNIDIDGTEWNIEEEIRKRCEEDTKFKEAWENRPPRGRVTRRQKRTRVRLVKGDKL